MDIFAHTVFKIKSWALIAAVASCLLLPTRPALAAELTVAAKKISGNTTLVSLIADKAELLAGMKIVIGFDSNKYSVGQLQKSSSTKNFIELVNDKQAGKAIVVMASAKGTSGNNIELFSMEMIHLAAATGAATDFRVLHCEMMDENLKEVSCR